ncbi:MAG: ahpC/TSA family protein [Xanthomonadaceae bacterium]|nr:ahpC/TSA family protein [Xanthomonadaceae bacterium]
MTSTLPKHALVAGCLVFLLMACNRGTDEHAAARSTVAKAPPPAATTPAPANAVATTPTKPDTPALKVRTIDGKDYDLAAHRDKWVVVNFWATWCGPCLKEMPELSALDAMREHIEVVGLAYEDITPAEMTAFLKTHPVVYPVAILDVYKPPADFATPPGLPMTYLIAPGGKVAKQFIGPVTARDIDAAISAAGGPKAG